ncbi:cryptochrome/photolyase family protein [Parahaliea aestuarii]|uniref:Deoxyribodipyrimidine photo-lyase n=1 Tax=Parahaliea aestuarii TaxID=1852021 RepID=A0A5C8ZTU6_9GAMM|nr:deoxyribodipyrimidine photo-lyase [Parahaliea aestuarii]TXS91090.1 deoxyribodipyrimidine photo-lyase [Parahaliea aestuarii]
MPDTIILWFRQDLRINDHPALQAAAAAGGPVLPLYILDDDSPGRWRAGGASRWWLHHSLAELATTLKSKYRLPLVLRRGEPRQILADLCRESGASRVFCSRQYEPWAASLEEQLHQSLGEMGITLRRFAGSLLFEPGSVLTGAGTPFKVFTPFWKACRSAPEPRWPLSPPDTLPAPAQLPASDSLADWQLTPRKPDWARGWDERWQPGSEGAAAALAAFLGDRLGSYSHDRDVPALRGTSGLSPHLHFGEISPRTVWHAASQQARGNPALTEELSRFLGELGWREFSYHLLHHFPGLPDEPFREAFRAFPWQRNDSLLKAWQAGQTGYPLVDAGMRELWQTGYMHNRVRMVAASFLTKHLLQPWQDGEAWFWDTLVDADLANNAASWQWVAGCGADAAPYFRIFNPSAQGGKFDPDGEYVRHWVPELARLPARYVHCPVEAPPAALEEAGIVLGRDYPLPLVDHRLARERALESYRSLSQ